MKCTFVFVHGLSGWGSYDPAYRRMPYWGMRGGDLIPFLRKQGFEAYAASVSPAGSAWDRACELYAQLAGTRVDYGAAHSRTYRHERFGRDFSLCPLIPSWDEKTRLCLLGHSFGGATVRYLAALLAQGDEEERQAVPEKELSLLFAGGFQERIHSLVALASPMNGTTAYTLFEDPAFDPSGVRVPIWSRGMSKMMSMGTQPREDGRDSRDYAGYDMHIDEALALNKRMPALPSVYYFSVPCSFTERREDRTWVPRRWMEPLFAMRSCQIGAYAGRTRGGMEIGEDWRQNDGLVNTFSAMAPIGDPSKPLDRERIEKGVWNVFPVFDGDHMALQGGLVHRHDIRPFYMDLLNMIEQLNA